MNYSNNPNIKQENKRGLRQLLLILLIALLVGGALGALLPRFSTTGVIYGAEERFLAATPYLLPTMTLLLSGAALLLYGQARGQVTQWDGEEEVQLQRIERTLGNVLFLSQLNLVVIFFLFGSFTYSLFGSLYDRLALPFSFRAFLIGTISFLLSIFVIVLLQKLAVDCVKGMNPEKRGSVFEVRFQKKWLESCDEAQQLIIYKTAYAGYRAGNYACITLWGLLVLGNILFDVGLFSIACVTIIWLTMLVASFVTSRRLSAYIVP